MRDQQGTDLEVGQIVAFNLSGTVAKGEIQDLIETPDPRVWNAHNKKYRIKVKLLHDAGGFPKGHISKVTRPTNVLVV